MLQKFLFCVLILTLSSAVFAQDDTSRGEVFVGYSNNQVETGLDDEDFNNGNNFQDFFNKRESFNGFTASGVGNVNRYIGIRGDVSGTYKRFDFDVPVTATTSQRLKVNASVYNFLGGVQVKNNSREGTRFRPFAYGMVGVAYGRVKLDNSSSFCQQAGVNCNDVGDSDTGFAAAFGGGMDIRATRRLSVRAFQIDYNPTRLNGSTQDNIRFGFGLVFH